MVFRPATPGFIVTLTATILLAVVSFNVPLLKSIYFLKASFSTGSDTGVITFGTLGYCLQLNNGTTCSKPSVGYQFNPNNLLGDSISFAQIPTVVVKWITYALVLHIVALVLAAIASVLGLLAHVRELSMTCFSSCVSGFGASIALVAFIFDLVLFFLARARINNVKGGSATIGISIWLTLAAWVLLFFSGCFFGLGRCCIGRRPRGPREPKEDNWNAGGGGGGGNNNYAEQMRLDAVKAEADRKARQKLGEGGLPAFQEHEVTKPLNYNSGPQYLEEDEDLNSPYRDHHAIGAGVAGAGAAYAARQGASASYRGGYAQAAPGTRAVDEYYSPSNNDAQSLYPPQAGHQQYEPSVHSQRPSTRTASNYAPSTYETPTTHVQSPTGHNQYLSTIGESGHSQYPSGRDYGHTAGGTTYHSAISHQQYPTAYSQTDPYAQPQATPLNPDTYNATSTLPVAALADPYASHQTAYPPTSPPQGYAQGYPTPQTYPSGTTSYYTAQTQPERSYTLGGGGYGNNVVPSPSPPHADPGPQYAFGGGALSNPRPDSQGTSYFPRAENQGFSNPHSPVPFSPQRGNTDPPIQQHEDSPPGYEPGPLHQATTTWPEKR
ncbi:pali-domain-containing protein [Rickenella mellea]|uniref:Pali-domain-containing protein n=1 Tax=Rickenella mellea TaxID=50990 RepID=A0A4Y7QM69_9AGAM|nr:pali-domain-containing protein [Rickenella mellea]